MPSFISQTGLMQTRRPCGSRPSDRSSTKIRSATPICGAASPTPRSAYIVAIMSSTRAVISGVIAGDVGGGNPEIRGAEAEHGAKHARSATTPGGAG